MAKYCEHLQDADPNSHPSRAAFDELKKRLEAGHDFFWRTCRICHERISIRLAEGVPEMVSCSCRPKHESKHKRITWKQLEKLLA